MCSSCAPPSSSLFLPTYTSFLLRRHTLPPTLILLKPKSRRPRLRYSASLAQRTLEVSWFPADQSANDYGGWAILDSPVPRKKIRDTYICDWRYWLFTGCNSHCHCSLLTIKERVVQLGCFGYLSLRVSSFKLRVHSMHYIGYHVQLIPNLQKIKHWMSMPWSLTLGQAQRLPNAESEAVASAPMERLERIIIPVAVDSTQQEALIVLKKLKTNEDDVKADELCTRREYARWLVHISASLERDAKHRLVPLVSLAGSVISAFDDVSVQDPDYGSIQALAEAGVIPSKLSQKGSSYDGLKGHGSINFSPDRFISRQDLIDWKSHLEYDFFPGVIEKISTTTEVGFMDVKEVGSDAPAGLYTDMLKAENSMLRKVFGQCKRFQPNKPSTKAQVAVALTSGRITEAISSELLRIKAENSARKAEIEDLRLELLDREDIQKFWNEKLNAEKARGLEVEKAYLAALSNLEQEKSFQEKNLAEILKEKSAMDCQRQLLLRLKEEVNEVSEKLASERSIYVAEKCDLHDTLKDLETKQEIILGTKSILEAEIEAIRILRSWVEDEARKSQARAKVLEEVGRRWKWDNQA